MKQRNTLYDIAPVEVTVILTNKKGQPSRICLENTENFI